MSAAAGGDGDADGPAGPDAGDPAGTGDPPRDGSGGPDGGGTRLLLPAPVRGELEREVEAAYPREACGVLLGREAGRDRRVEAVHAAENRWPDGEERGERYLVDPRSLRRLMDREAAGEPTILGFYHSHPEAEPVPSATDRELAWPWYLYLILPVSGGAAGAGRAWELDEEDGEFRERPVVAPEAPADET